MPDDLPAIDPSLDAPLPQVDPNSQLVPYRLSRTAPGGQPVVTTGYGLRARPPIQPPGGGGVGMPSLDRIYQAAFSNLPVDEAIKAVEAATRYQAQRGYQQDLQSGMNAAQAFAKWGPMLFKQATGVPESIERTVPPPITPQQMIQNRLNQQKFEAAQAAAKAKANAGELRSVGGVLYRVRPGQQPEALTEAPAQKPTETVTEEYEIPAVEGTPSKPASKGFFGFGAHPEIPAVADQPAKKIKKTRKVGPSDSEDELEPPNPAQTKTKEVIRTTKDGRKAVFDADTKKFIRYAE